MSLAYFSQLFDLIYIQLPSEEHAGDDEPAIIVDPISCIVVAVIRCSEDEPPMPPPRRRPPRRRHSSSLRRWLGDYIGEVAGAGGYGVSARWCG
jgi:hypothetical protein